MNVPRLSRLRPYSHEPQMLHLANKAVLFKEHQDNANDSNEKPRQRPRAELSYATSREHRRPLPIPRKQEAAASAAGWTSSLGSRAGALQAPRRAAQRSAQASRPPYLPASARQPSRGRRRRGLGEGGKTLARAHTRRGLARLCDFSRTREPPSVGRSLDQQQQLAAESAVGSPRGEGAVASPVHPAGPRIASPTEW